MVRIGIKRKIYLTKKSKNAISLEQHMGICRWLWNRWLAETRKYLCEEDLKVGMGRKDKRNKIFCTYAVLDVHVDHKEPLHVIHRDKEKTAEYKKKLEQTFLEKYTTEETPKPSFWYLFQKKLQNIYYELRDKKEDTKWLGNVPAYDVGILLDTFILSVKKVLKGESETINFKRKYGNESYTSGINPKGKGNPVTLTLNGNYNVKSTLPLSNLRENKEKPASTFKGMKIPKERGEEILQGKARLKKVTVSKATTGTLYGSWLCERTSEYPTPLDPKKVPLEKIIAFDTAIKNKVLIAHKPLPPETIEDLKKGSIKVSDCGHFIFAIEKNRNKMDMLSRQRSKKRGHLPRADGKQKKKRKVPTEHSNEAQKLTKIINQTSENFMELRNDQYNTIAQVLTNHYDTLIFDNENIQKMMKKENKNKKETRKRQRQRNRNFSDIAIFKLKTKIQNKCKEKGKIFHTIKKEKFASSQLCNACGATHKKETKLYNRIYDQNGFWFYVCSSCGNNEDGDINASKNILRQGLAELEHPTVQGYNPEAYKKRMETESKKGAELF